jgi:GcrA cell cycle regulator
MQSTSWTPEHSEALREQIVRGVSYGEAADAINAKFGTAYTRSAAIGRGKRMGLATPARSEDRAMLVPRAQQPAKKRAGKLRENRTVRLKPKPVPCPSAPTAEAPEPVKLRCVGISPRLLSLVELDANECRYPYGGDQEGEAISFCGHPCFKGSSYCAPHFHLTRAPAIEAERPAGPFVLRLVQAA